MHEDSKLKTHAFSFEILEKGIEDIYCRLQYSTHTIFNMVQNDIYKKGYYNPKWNTIIESKNKKAFEDYQELLRNLNSEIYYYSLLLVSFSSFEISLKQICLFIEQYSEPKYPFDPPNRLILKNCRDFINSSKLVDMTEKEIDSNYSFLTKINDLRNLIAHNNGNLIQNRNLGLESQKYYRVFNSEKFLTINLNGQVYINDDEYIKEFNRRSKEFLNNIINTLKK